MEKIAHRLILVEIFVLPVYEPALVALNIIVAGVGLNIGPKRFAALKFGREPAVASVAGRERTVVLAAAVLLNVMPKRLLLTIVKTGKKRKEAVAARRQPGD